jgi:phosphoribosylformylglycinamidine (FGAM) synthase-like amidotransferase family enzyme
MGFSSGDKAECKEIAREIVKEVLLEHIKSCPHGKTIFATRFIVIGICFGTAIASFAGSTVAITVAKMLLSKGY